MLLLLYWRCLSNNSVKFSEKLCFWRSVQKQWKLLSFRSSHRRSATLLKKRLWHRCFPVNFAKFLRKPFLQDTSGRLLLFFGQSNEANSNTCLKHIELSKFKHTSQTYRTQQIQTHVSDTSSSVNSNTRLRHIELSKFKHVSDTSNSVNSNTRLRHIELCKFKHMSQTHRTQ